MSTPPWMPLYIGDYRADTPHLNAAQHGAYLLLIMHYWQQGGLPDDDEQLARIACMSSAEWRRNRPVLRAFFSEGWRHGRVDFEITEAIKRYERRAKAGRKGNIARWRSRNAIALGSQSQSSPHPLRGSPIQGEEVSEGTTGGDTDQTDAGQTAAPSHGGRPALKVVNGSAMPSNSGEDEQ